MGKEQRKGKSDGSRTCILKVDMHCECTGCVKKINDGVKDISLSEGVERADLFVEAGEVKVVGTMDPEKICYLLHEATKKCVKILAQSNLSEGHIAMSQQTKNLFGQAPSDPFAPEAGETASSGWKNGISSTLTVTPSAPPLPEACWRSETVPCERCSYRWPSPSGTLGVWAAAPDVTATLAMYEL